MSGSSSWNEDDAASPSEIAKSYQYWIALAVIRIILLAVIIPLSSK